MRKPKYYNISHLLKDYPDCQYYIAFGERSNGKTYSALDLALRNYFSKGEHFAYIRRFGEDVRKKNLLELFSSHVLNNRIAELSGSTYNSVDYTVGQFVPIKVNDDTGKIERAPEPMGFAFDLNSTDHHKSVSYPRVTTIIFDEFLSRKGYLTNEFVLFMNTLSTLIRDRKNVKIFMIGNTVNKYCPYFKEMGLTHIKEQKPGTIDLYTYGESNLSVVVEYCDPMAKKGGKDSDIYFAFDNPQLKMITGGSWEIAIYPHLEKKYRPKDVIYNAFLIFDEQLLHLELIITENDYFMFVHPKTTPIKLENKDIIYTDKPNVQWNYRVGLSNQRDQLSMFIMRLISENRVFYADNETGEILRNYIQWSNQYSSTKGT